MPEKAERMLRREASKQGMTGKEADRYVYGTLRHKFGWKPKREKKKKQES
jgi:hypothetical protein